MHKSTLAGAVMIAVAAIAVPVVAWSAGDSDGASPQAGQEWHGGSMGGPMGRPMDGPMHRGLMERVMDWHRHLSPQQACIDRIARRAGFVATMGFKLNLTDAQKPLWDKVVAASQAAQNSEKQVCSTLPAEASARGKETVVDRLQHMQAMMQARLQGLQQAEPAVEALYNALTPDQKAILDHPFRRG